MQTRIYERGLFWLSLSVTLLTTLTLTALFIPLSWFPVEGTFRYEYALRPSVHFWWNQTEPIDANSVAKLKTFGSPNYSIVEENLASANAEYLHVVSSFGLVGYPFGRAAAI